MRLTTHILMVELEMMELDDRFVKERKNNRKKESCRSNDPRELSKIETLKIVTEGKNLLC
jgi:hypothetical protein